MTLVEALHWGTIQLEHAGATDAQANAGWLLSEVTGIQRLLLPLEHRAMAAQEQARYEACIARLAQGEPLQYVLGVQHFGEDIYKVDARVLIPREDTLVLCQEAVARIGGRPLRVLDIGSGSGAVAITIKKRCPQADVTSVDISTDALALARENAKRLGAAVNFVHSDVFSALGQERFDLIVSNPPYIRTEEMPLLQQEVQREPKLALDGGADGLNFYRRIIDESPRHLQGSATVLFEIGYDQAQDVLELFARGGYCGGYVKKDLAGLDRVVGAYRERP